LTTRGEGAAWIGSDGMGSGWDGDQTTKRFRMLMNAQIQQTNLNDSRSQSRRCRSWGRACSNFCTTLTPIN